MAKDRKKSVCEETSYDEMVSSLGTAGTVII
jgi:hypothetical protein